MESDFSGWATKANIRCSDGKTIAPNAFQEQDRARVPLVWQHGHTSATNVLGHAILENRPDGVYAHCFFNKTAEAKHAAELVHHKDITMLSIWANQLVQKMGKVVHGAIREVSLVLSGANPGANIETVSIRHSDDSSEDVEDELVIKIGEIVHSDGEMIIDPDAKEEEPPKKTEVEEIPKKEEAPVVHATGDDDPVLGEDVYDTMNDEQKALVELLVGAALESVQHSDTDNNDDTIDHAELGKEGNEMKRNVFDTTDKDGAPSQHVLSHDAMKGIYEAADKTYGTLSAAVAAYAEEHLEHGVEDIDLLFPDAQATDSVPQFLTRRMEWVDVLLNGVHKSPFNRIKTVWGDLTFEQARAKGYVTGAMKKEQFFKVARRITTPTTIYKKQKLDRDDVVDITDFDVAVWVKGDMRVMLDEELARAILVGDGREADDEDKVDEDCLRPISEDSDIFTTTVSVNIGDANSSFQEVIDALILERSHLRGTGLPVMFTTEYYIARALLLKDSTGRDLYDSIEKLATKLRVSKIVPVEVLEEYPDIVCVLVNPMDYTLGATKGGQVSFFDDFDIDYNQLKYLIETRACGALHKLKSAMVVKKGAFTLVVPEEPGFVASTGVITIPTVTGVVYKDEDGDTLTAGAQTALDPGASAMVFAYPSSASYAFAQNDTGDNWEFTRDPA